MTSYSAEAMRARFQELKGKRDAVRHSLVPLRSKRDAIEQEAAIKIAPIDDEIAKHTKALKPIKEEMALLNNALGGKTWLPK